MKEWQKTHPALPVVFISLTDPKGSLHNRVISPWDEMVYLPGYYDISPEARHEVILALHEAMIAGRRVR